MNITNIFQKWGIPIIVGLFIFLSSCIGNVSIIDSIRFSLTQFFVIFLPGFCLLYLLKFVSNDKIQDIFLSYALGYSLSIILYLCLLLLNIQKYIIYSYAPIVLISLYIFVKRNIGMKHRDCNMIIISIILFCSYLIATFTFQCVNISALNSDKTIVYNQDLMFWMRNCVAAAKDYPLPNLSISDLRVYYHYFSSIHIACLHYISGIEFFDLCFTYSHLINLFLFVGGGYVLCTELIHNAIYKYWAILFLLFTTGLDKLTHIYLGLHIYVVSFGYVEGISLFLFALLFIIRIYKNTILNIKELTIGLCFFAISTGLKAPLSSILLVGIGVFCLFFIFKKFAFFKGSIIGVLYLIFFITIIGFFIRNGNQDLVENTTKGLSISITDTLFHSGYFQEVYTYILNIINNTTIAYIVCLFLYSLVALFIPLCLFVSSYKNNKNTWDEIQITFWIMIAIGYILTIFVSQNGMSQMYFLFVSTDLMIISAFLNFDKATNKSNNSIRLFFMFGTFLLFIQIIPIAKKGFENVIYKTNSIKFKRINKEEGNSLTKEEVLGLKYMRNLNLNPCTTITNKVLCSKMGKRSFVVSSFTETQSYLESYQYSTNNQNIIEDRLKLIKAYFNGMYNNDELKKRGVTHAIVFMNIKNNNYSGKVIFQNKEIKIVEL